jgi:tetratricopeptide (TPR) repeat protein
LAGARRAAERGNTSAQARCLLTASILAGNGKYWHLARDLIEEALSLDALSPQETARAKLQHAYTLSGFDRHTIALDILSTIDKEPLKGDPVLEGQYWHGVAQARKHNGDYSEALKASRKAWSRHREVGDRAEAAKALAIEAECLERLGRAKRARRQADEALQEAEGCNDEFAQCAALCCAGRLALQGDDLSAADLLLRRCIRIAERIGHRPMACEARIEQYALERRRGRKRMTERLAGRLRKEIAIVPLDRETLDRFRDLD